MERFLNQFSYNKIKKGAGLYLNNNVLDFKLEKNKITGHVEDFDQEVFSIAIDIINPTNSTCSCSKNGLCEHMVALYFEVYPDEAISYTNYEEDEFDEEFYTCDFDDDIEYYECLEEHQREQEKFDVSSIIFNKLLKEHIDSLPLEELKESYRKHLLFDKCNTFNNYLKKKYYELLENSKNDDPIIFLEKIKNRVKLFVNKDFDSYLFDDQKKIFDKDTLLLIEKVYSENLYIRDKMNLLLLKQDLFAYEDYLNICAILKKYLDENELRLFVNRANNYFKHLKNISIRNNDVKSNALILIYELSNKDIDKEFDLLAKNLKYVKFVRYLISNSKNKNELFKRFKEQKHYRNGYYAADAYQCFYDALDINDSCSKDALELYHFYTFIRGGNEYSLNVIVNSQNWNEYYNYILASNNREIIIKTLIKTNNKKELLDYLMQTNNVVSEELIVLLKDEYNDILKEYCIKKFYDVLKNNYENDYIYIANKLLPLTYLDNGKSYINEVIDNLSNSKMRNKDAIINAIEYVMRKKHSK